MEYSVVNYLRPGAKLFDLRKMNEVQKKLYESAHLKNSFLHELVFWTDQPKLMEIGDAIEHNPYHFFFYMLARFYWFDAGDNEIIYYYPNKQNTYFSETALNSLPPRFRREYVKREGYEYVESPGCLVYKDSTGEPWMYAYVRDLYKHIWADTKQEKGKFTYLSRNKVNRKMRMITNEEEVLPHLKTIGFSVYSLEDLTFDQQIKLFRSSEIITGLHGAGLSHLVFCEPGTLVLELNNYGREDIKNHYMDISVKCGLRYYRSTALENVEDGLDNKRIQTDVYLSQLKELVQSLR